jgi:hypothetical protein
MMLCCNSPCCRLHSMHTYIRYMQAYVVNYRVVEKERSSSFDENADRKFFLVYLSTFSMRYLTAKPCRWGRGGSTCLIALVYVLFFIASVYSKYSVAANYVGSEFGRFFTDNHNNHQKLKFTFMSLTLYS